MTLEPLKILLVEDILTDAHWVQEMLWKVGAAQFELTQVTSKDAAIAYLENQQSNVILFALSLSEKGLEAVKQLDSLYPDVPIVVISNVSEEAIAGTVEIGAQDYLIKSQTDAQLLIRTLRNAIERQKLRYELQQTKQALQQQTKRNRLLVEIAQQIQRSLPLNDILQSTVTEVRQILGCDRVSIYRLDTEQTSAIVAESVAPDCSVPNPIPKQQKNSYVANDVYQHLIAERLLMTKLQVQADVVVPIMHKKIWGLLTVHQCTKERQWQQEEIDFLQQTGVQVAIAIQQPKLDHEVNLLDKDVEIHKVIPDQGLVKVEAIEDITKSKQNEELTLYREIIANSNSAIAIINPQGYYLEQNAAHRILIGYSDDELCGKTPVISLGEQVFSAIYTELLKNGRCQSEVLSQTKSGTSVYTQLSAFSVRDPVGKLICYVLSKRDITQRKQAEAAIIERDRLLQGVAAATNHLLTTQDFPTAITEALAALGEACNVDRVYIFENHIHPETGEPLMSQRFEWVRETVAPQINNPELQNLPYSLFSPHWYSSVSVGKTIHGLVRDFPESERVMLEAQDIVSIMIVPIFLESGFWGFIGFDDCHTERQWTETEQAIIAAAGGSFGGAIARRRSQEALEESEQRFRLMADSAPVLIWISGVDAVCTFFNKPWLDFRGHTLEQELNTKWTGGVHPEDLQRSIDTYISAFNARQNFVMEYRLRRADGEYRWLLDTGVPRFTTTGSFAGYIGSSIDISDRKQAEIELHHNKQAAVAGSRAKSEFLATMSHELRTPLNAILGLSHLLQEEIFGSLNAKQKEYVSCIHSSGEHLLALINDILDLSKVEAGKEELIYIPVQVREVCDYCLGIVRERAFEKRLQLTSQFDAQAEVCIGDERRIKQMLLNLLINAIKFTPAGSVSLQVQKVSQGIAFTVVDTGIGIASEQLKLLFQPFQQLDSQLNRQYEGTGLGLALTRKLARLHGGDVTVQSTLGEGSRFTLLLPDYPRRVEASLSELSILPVQESKSMNNEQLSMNNNLEIIDN